MFHRFLPFNCCICVVLLLDKGDYPENLQIVFVLINSILLNLLSGWIHKMSAWLKLAPFFCLPHMSQIDSLALEKQASAVFVSTPWKVTQSEYTEFVYFVFTRMPVESYRRRLRSLLYLCDVFRALITSLVCWFCTSALGLVPFQISYPKREIKENREGSHTRPHV